MYFFCYFSRQNVGYLQRNKIYRMLILGYVLILDLGLASDTRRTKLAVESFSNSKNATLISTVIKRLAAESLTLKIKMAQNRTS